jgi:hypothetical protein
MKCLDRFILIFLDQAFSPKDEKLKWKPCQSLEFLGIHLNCEQGTIHVPSRRHDKVADTIKKTEYFLERNLLIKVRRVASLVGQIISMSVVIGSVSQLMTKCLSIDTCTLVATPWSSMIFLSKDSID